MAAVLVIGSPGLGYDYWNDIRHSALLPDNSILIRLENPFGNGVENYLLYAEGDIVEKTMVPVDDGPSTVFASAPGPVASPFSYGFRLVRGSELDLMPVHIAEGRNPAPVDLTCLASDRREDHLFDYVNLDLTDCRVGFSDTRIFAALENAGGGFPVNQGLTFFGYLLAIADPALADPDTIFTIMHTYNQGSVVSPGLYKITGSGFGDLHRIGDISVQEVPSANSLLLSCDIAALMADPDFHSWYNLNDPAIGVAAFTQRITLIDGALEADRTSGGRCHLRRFAVQPSTNILPQISGLSIQGEDMSAYARLDYFDPDSHCPVIAEVSFDEGTPYSMYPQSLKYGRPVEYRTETGIEPLANDAWSHAVARFSDNLSDTVKAEITMTGIATDDHPAMPRSFQALVFPNPFNTSTSIQIGLPYAEEIRIDIFDIRGGLVRAMTVGTIDAGTHHIRWNGCQESGLPVASGLYLCRISSARGAIVQKVLLIR